MLRIVSGMEIRSVAAWHTLAPPQHDISQWADGRSAKELAKAWFPVAGDPQVPPEFQALLDSRRETRGTVFDLGEPERVTPFDDCSGGGRDADLVLWGHGPCGKVLVCLEAKADEPFGEPAAEHVRKRTALNPESRTPERFELLCRGVLGLGPEDERAQALRFQLLTATAGTLVEAEMYGADATLFAVHEFIGRTDPEKVAANAAHLNSFIRLLSKGRTQAISPGMLGGPFSVPGNKNFAGTKRLFVGKCRRVL
jgi:hypothetical protein